MHSCSFGLLHLAVFIRRELVWFCSGRCSSSRRQAPINILKINSPLPPIKIKGRKMARFDLWFFGGWVPFPFYSVQDCSLPLPWMKYTRGNRETVQQNFLRKQPDGHPGLSLNHTNSKFKVLAAGPAYLMIQSRLQHLFQMVRWDYWDTKVWRQLIMIWYTTIYLSIYLFFWGP